MTQNNENQQLESRQLTEREKAALLNRLQRLNWLAGASVIACFILLLYAGFRKPPVAPVPDAIPGTLAADTVETSGDRVVDGIHVATGLVYADGFEAVRKNCTGCHSGKLVTQNKATREGWEETIRWMQATQGLWNLGDSETQILDYLATHYAPEQTGRRSNLDVDAIEWYILELE